MHHLQVLKNRILEINGTIKIPLQGAKIMTVEPVIINNEVIGVNVDNLGNQPFLSMDVFIATISLLTLSNHNEAVKGSAQGGRLETDKLPIDSVEGRGGPQK